MRATPLSRLWVVGLATLALAACGGGDDDEEQAAGKASGEVSVVVTWTGSELDAFRAVVDGFEQKNPDVSVELRQIPFEELNSQVTQQFVTGSPPDLTVALPGLIRQLGEQDLLLSLDDMWDEWAADGAYTESLREIASVDGTPYAAWFKGNVNALIWYQPPELERLGLEVPGTWDEFISTLDEIKATGEEPFAVGGGDLWPLTQWLDPILARVAGPEAFSGLVDGTVDWDDPRVVRSFELFGRLIADYFPSNALDRGFIDEVCAWVDDKAAFINQGAFVNLVAPGECDADLRPGRDFTFFLMPKVDEGNPEVQFISGDLFAVAKDGGNVGAATALARYLGSAEGQEIWAKRGGFIAPNANVSLDVYPDANDRKAAELWPKSDDAPAVYDLDDAIGGEVQNTLREALQQFVRDQDVDALVSTMKQVDERQSG
jgi:alpha-glucoside transport system substrate-binding protein